MLWLALWSLALASDPFETWVLSHEAALMESLQADLTQAERRYANLVRNALPAGDPALAQTLLRLGKVRYVLGDIEGARDSLDACIRTGVDKASCLDVRSRIDLEVDAVHTVPLRWTFDDPQHGFLHPRSFWDKGTIRIRAEEGDTTSTLEWTTQVDAVREDLLVVGFRDPTPAPATVSLTATSVEFDATVQLVFEDLDGHQFEPRPRQVTLPRGDVVTLTVPLATLQPVGDEQPASPAELHRLYLIDVSGRFGQLGRNAIRLDDFQVR